MIRVLVIDDSAMVRQVLRRELSKERDIQVVGVAPDPYVARELIIKTKPHVLTLDIEMPRMDGLTFLRKIMKYHPIPTIIVSSLTSRGSKIALDALEYGAFDIITKPGVAYSVADAIEIIVRQIRAASVADISRLTARRNRSERQPQRYSLARTTQKVVLIGGSTGATIALEELLLPMPPNAPGMAVVIHMPPGFTSSFAKRLDSMCAVQVREAVHGDQILPGRVLLAPGNYHMEVLRRGAGYYVRLHQKERLFYQRPCVDLLFRSGARYIAPNGVAVMLTGMGKDGASAMGEFVQAGGKALIQDEASSIVWGMPGEAFKQGVSRTTIPLQQMARAILHSVTE
ncbi:protein-glutamate methylesterase/protein-glutamine glutaminase [Chitinivibrio alkaliphilus]|uniref:Protein-glutamate methylesterase/protein-glutamine glutaminase n=1 Tax=Chitinivibrio alkaliphilus ACht1 TaxID=1313304 RepID=U7D6Z5_9BACT|nr:chemotaxis response regulator protein-glutamate methylesterase [Chitinivibrio alkaliphilus]ERP31718.1 response regulator receiver modulated CheB methylesterase [Chitinivibrio alkaliphilus ACht1]